MKRHYFVCDVVNLRGQLSPVINLLQVIGIRPLVPYEHSIIVIEYNSRPVVRGVSAD